MEYDQRMGDGRLVRMTKEAIREDIEAGAADAADRGKIPTLSDDDVERLLDIMLMPGKAVTVEIGNEVVMSTDVGHSAIDGNYSECGGSGVPLSATSGNQILERSMGADCTTFLWYDYTYKAIKAVITQQQQELESILMNTICPCAFGAMPNLGAYYKPDGPFENVGDMMSEGKIMEGMEVYEQAAEAATEDVFWVAKQVDKVGVDNIMIDTAGAAGDGDLLASLKATEIMKKQLGISVEMGMANEYVLGVHGGMQYAGERLAGMYAHQLVKVAEKAGVDIFGPVCNTNTRMSTPWNVARAVTFLQECDRVSDIPLHPNMGMGVGGIPMVENPTLDAVTKASKAMVEIGGADGI
jgi:dimethylamine--corrinoid protein Co-methyltransferase